MTPVAQARRCGTRREQLPSITQLSAGIAASWSATNPASGRDCQSVLGR